jgi:hypothetical protein
LGILHGQGFLWSTAVPVAELHDTLTRITRRRRRPAALLENEYADRALLQRIATLHRTGASASTIAAMLNAERLLTRRGTQWRPASVLKVLNDLKQSNEL